MKKGGEEEKNKSMNKNVDYSEKSQALNLKVDQRETIISNPELG